MENTGIDNLPSNGIRASLQELYLSGTKNLKRYEAYESGAVLNINQTYPFLRIAEFFYHAHCCQMQDHHYYLKAGKKREIIDTDLVEFKRNADTTSDSMVDISEGYVCVNISDRSVIHDISNITLFKDVTANEFCDSEFCISEVCGDRCFDESSGDIFSGGAMIDVYCIEISPSTCLDQFYSADNITTQVTSNVCTDIIASPSPTVPSCPNVCDEGPIVIEDFCECTHEHEAELCKKCAETDCTVDPVCSTLFLDLFHCHCFKRKRSIKEYWGNRYQKTMEATDNTTCLTKVFDAVCRVRLNHTMEEADSVSSSIQSQQVPQSIVPSSSALQLQPTSPTPTNTPLQTQSKCGYDSIEEIGPLILPSGWFYPDSDSKNSICMELASTTIIVSPTPIPTKPVKLVEGSLTSCNPVPNDFNPCEDLLGNDFLRAAIWLVIIFAIFGNGIVLFVFITHAVIIRRTKVRFFSMHFLYANLAAADFLMSIYLLTIASVDADTKGNFSEEDIVWRTGPGCGFAGFCAVTSTVVSVYALVVITSERLYTITYVMHRRQFTKVFALIVMICGWLLGILIAILPLVGGVNSYELVAICLPFDSESPSSRAYIVTLLLFTGLSFVYIAISYSIIFYQVILSPTKRKLVRSGGHTEQWKADLRMTVRMFVLVMTNFVCWFPIALVSLTAAFGEPLQGINVATAKFFVVFVFPLNACVNPFLYTLSTRAFKQNFVALLGRCGLCRDSPYSAFHSRMFGLPSSASTRTNETAASRRSSVISQLVSMNFTMFTNRRTSLASDNNNNSTPNLRRPSQISMGSNEDTSHLGSHSMLHIRRSSGFSQDSNEESTSCSIQVTPIISVTTHDKDEKHNNARIVLNSASSLGVLHEVDEVSDMPNSEPMIKLNPGYRDENDSQTHDKTHSLYCNGTASVNSETINEQDTVDNIVETSLEENHTDYVANILHIEGDSEDTLSVHDDIHNT